MLTLGNVRHDLEMLREPERARNAHVLLRLGCVLIAFMHVAITNPMVVAQEKRAEKPPAEGPVVPRGYKVIPGKLPRTIVRMAQSGQVGSPAQFEGFYKALIAQFTQPEHFAETYDYRKNLLRDARTAYNSKTSKQFHTALNQLFLSTLRDYVTDPLYHPAARFNWMLIIGDLNQAEKPRNGNGKAVPLPEALPVLIAVAGDETQPDSVRLAALIGLDRHAKAGGIADAVQQPLVASLQKIVARRTPPEGRDPEVHRWFQDRAGAILEALGEEVTKPAEAPEAADGADAPDANVDPAASDGPDDPEKPADPGSP